MNGCWIVKIFPTKILHLNFFVYCIFYGYDLLTWVSGFLSLCRILKYFCLISDKKDPPKVKELYSIYMSGPLSKVIPIVITVVATELCIYNAEVTKIEAVCY